MKEAILVILFGAWLIFWFIPNGEFQNCDKVKFPNQVICFGGQ